MITGCSTPTNNNVEGQKDQTHVIKIGHAAAKEHFAQSSFEKFKELVEGNSKGKIKVEIYPEGELGGEREMLEQVLLGELTMIAPAIRSIGCSTNIWQFGTYLIYLMIEIPLIKFWMAKLAKRFWILFQIKVLLD